MPSFPAMLYPFRNLIWVTSALLALTIIGTTGMHLIEGWGWFDSFYMVLTTFTTIGYGEIHPLSHQGRIFNSGLIIVGVVLFALLFGTLTQLLLEFELLQFFGKRKMERQISRLSNHYIICGAGRVGRSTARELAAQSVPFVVVDQHLEEGDVLERDWLFMEGDATHEKTLQVAGIERAAGLVAAITTDAGNIFIVLTARSLNPKLKIIARASEEEAARHLKKAGADIVVSPYLSAGQRIAQGLLRPNVLDFVDLTAGARDQKLTMIIEEIQVHPNSPLAGITIGNSGIHRDFGVIILAIKHADGRSQFNPRAHDLISPGDYLIAMGDPQSMVNLQVAVTVRS
ncbi:MAG TPA: potassium channel protein [Terriglobales bacterium]